MENRLRSHMREIANEFRTCFLIHSVHGDRLLPRKLEVWEWVVKRRIFDPFSEFSELVCFVSEFSVNLHVRPFRVG